MGLQRERVPAGVAALLAVLLTLPSVVAPTWQLTTLDSQSGVVLFDQQFWSWGRSRALGAGGAVVQDLWNPFGLAALVLLVALAAGGAVAWMLAKAPWVSLVALLSWAGLLGHLATTAADRLGRPVRDDVHGLAASGTSTTVGALESVAVLALVVAVALLVLSLAGLRMPSAWVARVRALIAPDEEDAPTLKHRGGPGELPPPPPLERPAPAAAMSEGVPGDVAVPGGAV